MRVCLASNATKDLPVRVAAVAENIPKAFVASDAVSHGTREKQADLGKRVIVERMRALLQTLHRVDCLLDQTGIIVVLRLHFGCSCFESKAEL